MGGGVGMWWGRGVCTALGWGKRCPPTTSPSPTGRFTPFLLLTLMGADSSRPPPIMNFNKLTGISYTGGAAAVGADSSRPPPIYRPPRDYRIILLKSIIGPYSWIILSI